MNLIDRDALVAKLEITEGCFECKWVNGVYCNRWNNFVDACEAILKAPVIEQPEIIRCKDCKYYRHKGDISYCINEDYGYGWNGDDFCSKGERREG